MECIRQVTTAWLTSLCVIDRSQVCPAACVEDPGLDIDLAVHLASSSKQRRGEIAIEASGSGYRTASRRWSIALNAEMDARKS